MAEPFIEQETFRRRCREALAAAPAPGVHPDEDTWVGLATGELPADVRATTFDHIVRCEACGNTWHALQALRDGAAAEDLAAAGPRWTSWMATPGVRYALAASLVMAIAASAWLGGRRAVTPSADVVRSGPEPAAVLAVAAVLDMEPAAEAVARRAVTLLTCPAPALGGGDRLRVSLAGPSSQVAWSTGDVDTVGGRVRVAVDLVPLEAGAWTLRLVRVDGAGREQGSTACGFELR